MKKKLIWITGLSGSGKTTIGKRVYKKLKIKYSNTIFLDGDDFRKNFGNDLGYSVEDRFKNALRIHRFCESLIKQDMNVVCATISLFKEIHILNKKKFKSYFDIYIECEMNELIKRNQKGIYLKPCKNVVGVNSTYDKPTNPKLIIENTYKKNLNQKVDKILNLIIK